MKLRVLVHVAEEGGFRPRFLLLGGCVSEGETYNETLANIREAAEGYFGWRCLSSDHRATPKCDLRRIEL